jgi:hypothetical protein
MPTGLSTFVRPALLALMAATASAAISGSPRTFDADPVGRPPAGFAFHAVRYSSAPRWLVQREGTNGFSPAAEKPQATRDSIWRCTASPNSSSLSRRLRSIWLPFRNGGARPSAC